MFTMETEGESHFDLHGCTSVGHRPIFTLPQLPYDWRLRSPSEDWGVDWVTEEETADEPDPQVVANIAKLYLKLLYTNIYKETPCL